MDSRGQTRECTGEMLVLYTGTGTMAWLSNQGEYQNRNKGVRDKAVLLYLQGQHYMIGPY